MEACELLTPAGTPLGFGEMEGWGDSIPRVLRTLGCMTQARWAWACGMFKVIFDISDESFLQPDICVRSKTTTPNVHSAVTEILLARKLNHGSDNKTTNRHFTTK